MKVPSKETYRDLAISAITRNCDGDNLERSLVFTVDDFQYYYKTYLKDSEF
jgi:hypothetical protein